MVALEDMKIASQRPGHGPISPADPHFPDTPATYPQQSSLTRLVQRLFYLSGERLRIEDADFLFVASSLVLRGNAVYTSVE